MNFFKLKLKNKEIKYEDVAVLDFIVMDKNKLDFKPGQYMNLSSPKNNSGRAYTIISKSEKKVIRFAIRKKGQFSTFLYGLKVNTIINADGPYGNFCPDIQNKKIICIANGIGITPFINWINSSDFKDKEFHFLFSNGKLERTPFLDKILENKKVKINLFITQQDKLKDNKIIKHRIKKKDIKKVLLDKNNTMIAICGSIGFVRDMWKISKSIGIKEENILTESFF